MTKSLSELLGVAVAAIMLAAPVDHACAQAIRVTGGEPVFDELFSPSFEGVKGKDYKPKAWLELEGKMMLEMSPEPPTKTCDRITVRWYLAVENPEKPNTYLLVSKEVQHVNIPLNEEVYTSAYLSPASILRVLGKSRNVTKIVEYVGYEVVFNGEVKFASTNKGRPGWWNAASEKISRSEAVSLLSKSETPFAHMWWDRYAEVEATKK